MNEPGERAGSGEEAALRVRGVCGVVYNGDLDWWDVRNGLYGGVGIWRRVEEEVLGWC